MKFLPDFPQCPSTLAKTLLVMMMSVAVMSPVYANSKPNTKPNSRIANLFLFGSENPTTANDEVADDGSDLSVLETQPNSLYGIEGLHQGRVPLGAVSPNTLKTFVSVVDLVRRDYVEDVNDEKLFRNAMRGVLTGLDRNAEFLDHEAFSNLQSFTMGNVAGVGLTASWREKAGHWVVQTVEPKTPSAKANIQKGDYIYQIGDVKLNESHRVDDVMQLLNGVAGTQVDVVVSRAGRSKRTVSLQRTTVLASKIHATMYGDVAVLKLPVFQTNTRQQILDSLGYAGVPIAGIILDVRNNPGGVLESARDVASLFMKNQAVVQIAGRNGTETLQTEGSALLSELPVIILQNRYSASASEVLASSLQAQGRAKVLGETSYGKGSVQSVVPLGDGQAVKMTTAHYLTTKGDKIDGVGVKPDVVIDESSSGKDDEWLNKAITLMNEIKLSQGMDFVPVGGF